MITSKEIEILGEEIIKIISGIYDPEIPVNIYELGLIYDVKISDQGDVKIEMTLTSPNCPVAESLPAEVEEKVKAIEKINDVEVNIVFDPAWTKEMMSEEDSLELGML
jgi:FeS assembly SUF system protein